MRIVILGLSITSSWGNGHATTYRALVRGLQQRGHQVQFLECDKPWYRENRDLPETASAGIALYGSLADLQSSHASTVRNADLVIVGSYVPDGVSVGDWVQATAAGITAFYDIDTPVTLAKLERADEEYLAKRQISRYGIYFSFTGGPTLRRIERQFGARMARALYCSVNPDFYFPEPGAHAWLMGYLGTYSEDRQPAIKKLLLSPARQLAGSQFVVAGPLYPPELAWPGNVARIEHLAPPQHREFYNSQSFTLNITRADMRKAGYSPSVRLFEAASCATAIISDDWPGLDELFVPGVEILVADKTDDVIKILTGLTEIERLAIGARARERVLREHTPAHRAAQLEHYVQEYRTGYQSADPVLVEEEA